MCWQGTPSKRLVVGLNNEHKEAARDSKSLAASLRVLWRCPTLPQPVGCSTIGAAGLSFQVRNGGWAFPRCYDHHKNWCSTRSPTVWGVWVDRGLYSGCGSVFTDSCWSPATRCVLGVLFSVGPLVPVGSRAHYCASTSGLSTRSSGGGLSPHGGAWKSHLEAGFPLRCFQRLSLPNVANQPCTWRYNWHTRGSSIPVLSY